MFNGSTESKLPAQDPLQRFQKNNIAVNALNKTCFNRLIIKLTAIAKPLQNSF